MQAFSTLKLMWMVHPRMEARPALLATSHLSRLREAPPSPLLSRKCDPPHPSHHLPRAFCCLVPYAGYFCGSALPFAFERTQYAMNSLAVSLPLVVRFPPCPFSHDSKQAASAGSRRGSFSRQEYEAQRPNYVTTDFFSASGIPAVAKTLLAVGKNRTTC